MKDLMKDEDICQQNLRTRCQAAKAAILPGPSAQSDHVSWRALTRGRLALVTPESLKSELGLCRWVCCYRVVVVCEVQIFWVGNVVFKCKCFQFAKVPTSFLTKAHNLGSCSIQKSPMISPCHPLHQDRCSKVSEATWLKMTLFLGIATWGFSKGTDFLFFLV